MPDDRNTPRAETVAGERRRRRLESVENGPLRLAAPEDVFDHEKYVYRWANDEGTRLIALTVHDDWDFVGDDKQAVKVDSVRAVKHHIGLKTDGSPLFAYLLRKPKEFAAEDREAKLARIASEEATALSDRNPEAPDGAYTPGQPRRTPKR